MLGACAVVLPQPTPEQLAPSAVAWQAPRPESGGADPRDWWSAWQDPALNGLLRRTLDSHPSLTQAAARIAEARADAAAAGAALWPTLTVNVAPSRSRNDLMPPREVLRNRSAGLDAQWEIDLWGGVAAARAGIVAGLAARESQWQDVRISLAAETANAYVARRACERQLAIGGEDLASRERSDELLRRKVDAGFTAAAEAELAAAATAEARKQLAELTTQCAVTLKTLVALSGLEESVLASLLAVGAGQLPMPPGLAVDSVPAAVLERRPDIRSAAASIRSAAAGVGVADSARYPSISLFGFVARVGQSSVSASYGGKNWSFGPSLHFPLFDSGRRDAELDAARARYEQTLAAYAQQVRLAVREVEEALVRIDSGRRRGEDQSAAIAGYRRFFLATDARLRVGSASQLELEEARRPLLAAESRLIALRREQASYSIALYKAIGGGQVDAAGQ